MSQFDDIKENTCRNNLLMRYNIYKFLDHFEASVLKTVKIKARRNIFLDVV